MQKLFLEYNKIGSEGATCIARIMSKDRHLQHVSLAHNPGEYNKCCAIVRCSIIEFASLILLPSLLNYVCL